MSVSDPMGSSSDYLVIDGQQRITTVSLLLLAMANLIKDGKVVPEDDTLYAQITKKYLVDEINPKNRKVKLKPIKGDQDAYDRLWGDPENFARSSNITQNYLFFYNEIQKQAITIDQLFKAVEKLQIIDITLTPPDDDPQLVFESLNSTGLELNEGDKIRNFVLMGLDIEEQERFYDSYWNPIEKNAGYNKQNNSYDEVFKTSEDVDDRLLWHWFKSPDFQKLIMQLQEGGVRLYFYYDKLCMGEVSLPLLEEQRKIGKLFDTLDNLITLHQRQPFLHSPPDISLIVQLTPPFYTFSWEQRKLGDIADIVGGGTPSTGNQSYWDGDIDWYAPAEIADQIYANSSQKKITGLGYENSSAKMLPPGTVLFTSRAGIGKTAILTRKGCTNQGFQSIVPHRGEPDSYFIFSRTGELKRYGELVGAGSTFVEVSGKQMAVMELMMPTMREQQTIEVSFSSSDHLITLHQRQTIVYAVIRSIRKVILAERQYFAPPMVRKSPLITLCE